MTSAVRRTVPPRVLVRLANPFVRMLLRSPAHGMLDPSVMLLHVTGRKTATSRSITWTWTGG
jgi:hypothetical protein